MAAVIAAQAKRIPRVAGRVQQVIKLRVLSVDAVHLALPAGMIGDWIGIGHTRAQMLRHQNVIPSHVFALLDRHVPGRLRHTGTDTAQHCSFQRIVMPGWIPHNRLDFAERFDPIH